MEIWQSILLGVIQGLTEWLPVSSSGHLVIFREFFKITTDILFDIILHIGSLIVLLIVFWKEIICIVKSFYDKNYEEYRRLIYLLVVGIIGTGIVAFLFKDIFESFFSSILVVGAALIVTGFLLLLTRKFEQRKEKMGYLDGLLIGITQGFALIPGISRSGSTISIGVLLGNDRNKATRFSFLLFIPAVIGSFILKLNEVNIGGINHVVYFFGFLASLIVSYITIRIFLKIIEKGKLYMFSYYCFVLGVLLIILALK